MGGDVRLLLSSLRDRDLEREGLVVAEGRLVTERLLAAPGFEALFLRCLPSLLPHFEPLVAGRCPLLASSEEEMARDAGFPFHRGVLAVARRPASMTAAELLVSGPGRGDLPPRGGLLLLPETRDPENLGALVRSAAAFGFEGILLGPRGADFLSRRVLRVSMGAVLTMPFARCAGPGDVGAFRRAGWSLVAAVVDAATDAAVVDAAGGRATDVDEWEPAPKTILALGEEYAGLGEDWLATADGRVTIRMALGPDSLNVSAAGAILMKRVADSLAAGRDWR